MQFLKSTTLFALVFAYICTSASALPQDQSCVRPGFPCVNVHGHLIDCCDGLQCSTLLLGFGTVGATSGLMHGVEAYSVSVPVSIFDIIQRLEL
jgi:hypothetical protein